MVREAAGEAAYAAGHYAEALADLRAAKRMNGATAYLPIMADCHRALGHPDQAVKLAKSPSVANFPPAAKAEMTIVEAGARRDMGQIDAALRILEQAPLTSKSRESWVVRLRYAYADALVEAGRNEDALAWFHRVTAIDSEDLTDAADRAAELEKSPPEPLDAALLSGAGCVTWERGAGVLGGPLQAVAVGDPDPVDVDHPGSVAHHLEHDLVARVEGGVLGRAELAQKLSGVVVTLTDPPWQTCGMIVTSTVEVAKTRTPEMCRVRSKSAGVPKTPTKTGSVDRRRGDHPGVRGGQRLGVGAHPADHGDQHDQRPRRTP